MKRVMLTVVCSLSLFATASFAHDKGANEHAHGGFGFHDISAPLGIRWWLSGEKAAIDVGVGYGSDPAAPAGSTFENETVNHFAIDLGVPFVMHSWDGVHVLFRPGLLYTSQQVGFDALPGPGETFDTDNETNLSVRAELEGEVFLRDNVTVSASTGIEFITHQDANTSQGGPDPDSQTSFGTMGRQFTQIGFHLYFLGGKE